MRKGTSTLLTTLWWYHCSWDSDAL